MAIRCLKSILNLCWIWCANSGIDKVIKISNYIFNEVHTGAPGQKKEPLKIGGARVMERTADVGPIACTAPNPLSSVLKASAV